MSNYEESNRKDYLYQNALYRVTEEKSSQILSTPDQEDHATLNTSDMQPVSNKLEFSNSHKKNKKLNDYVTKVDPLSQVIPQYHKNQRVNSDPIYFEQGQNNEHNESFEKINIQNMSHHEANERLIDQYVEKETPEGRFSTTKSEQSQAQSSRIHDSPIMEEDEHQSELHKAHLIQTLQAIQYIKTLSASHSLEGKYLNLPDHPSFESPESTKTIIFDLDETLVHCVDDPETDNPHVVLKVTFPSGESVDAGINIRPYAIE